MLAAWHVTCAPPGRLACGRRISHEGLRTLLRLGLGAMRRDQAARTMLGEARFTSVGTVHLDRDDGA